MRLLIATVFGCLALVAPASASYLHMSEAKPAAQQFVKLFSVDEVDYGAKLGNCWRAGPRAVQCGVTQDEGYSAPQHDVAIITLRGDRLHGHALVILREGRMVREGKRYFLGRVEPVGVRIR